MHTVSDYNFEPGQDSSERSFGLTGIALSLQPVLGGLVHRRIFLRLDCQERRASKDGDDLSGIANV